MITVLPNENLVKIAVRVYGSAFMAFDLGVVNNILSLSESLTPGQKLAEAIKTNSNFLSFEELFKSKKIEVPKTVVTNPYQTLLDIATQEDGNALALFEWAVKNNINPTDKIIPGQLILSLESTQRRFKVANYFKGKGIKIATADYKPIFDYYFPGEFPYSF